MVLIAKQIVYYDIETKRPSPIYITGFVHSVSWRHYTELEKGFLEVKDTE